MNINWNGTVAGLVLAFSTLGAAAAQTPCKPILIATLDISREPGGAPGVMLALNGKPQWMLLGTASMHSYLSAGYVESAGIAAHGFTGPIIHTSNGLVTKTATLDSLAFGPAAVAKNVKMYVDPDGPAGNNGAAGVIGVNLLANFGVDSTLQRTRSGFSAAAPVSAATGRIAMANFRSISNPWAYRRRPGSSTIRT